MNPELQEGFATLLYKQVHYAKINQSTGQNSTQRLTYNSQKRNCRLRGNGMRPELREYPALRSTKSSQKHNCQPQKGNWVTPEQREAFRRTLNNTPAGYGAASQNLGGNNFQSFSSINKDFVIILTFLITLISIEIERQFSASPFLIFH